MTSWDELARLDAAGIAKASREMVGRMTLKQKAWQMAGDERLVPGGIHMMRRYNDHPLPAGRDDALSIPPVLFMDGPRGIVMGASTCFPVPMARGASWDVDLERRIGNAIGIEARAQGANFFGGVCINLLRHPAWGRAQETFGEDAYHLGRMGVALVEGTQKHVMACAKHYACNSMENARFKVDVQVDERALHEVYLPHFKACVDAGVASIMSAYNKVNGEHCGHNARLLRGILKEEWRFAGFVISDFLLGVRKGKDAINAGLDIEMPFQLHMKPGKIARMVKKGLVPESLIDEAATRIIETKLRFHVQPDPVMYAMEKVACKEHVELAYEAAWRGMVLLKNVGDILPVRAAAVKSIAVIGRLASVENIGDLGSSCVYPPHVITARQGIESRFKESGTRVTLHDGNHPGKAAAVAGDADVAVVVAGYTRKDEGEYTIRYGGDRTRLRLHDKDVAMIESVAASNPRTIVVLEGGSAIITRPWDERVPAILMAWYPGMEGGRAIAAILAGDVAPCGKLPLTVPDSENQLPYFDKDARSIDYGYYHGYRLVDKEGWNPAYSFGFGKSYTTFTYEDAAVDKSVVAADGLVSVSVNVRNAGTQPGEEIVQLYIAHGESSVERPVKELKGFTKVFLQPGRTRRVELEIRVPDVAWYDAGRKAWRVEPGPCTALVGCSSAPGDLVACPFTVE